MQNKFIIVALLAVYLLNSCANQDLSTDTNVSIIDSVKLSIESQVRLIIESKDSLVMIPSLRFAKGVDETYTAKMYGKNQITKYLREEKISNTVIQGRDYYYENGDLIFIKEEGSVFHDSVEKYTERLIYFVDDKVYMAFEKFEYTESDMFTDTLFKPCQINILDMDIEKPYRALKQQSEFAMYFDEFLIIDPQSYLIVENRDKSINAALYIIEGDSLLNTLYDNPKLNYEKPIYLYHSFKEMNGIERMIYEGGVLLTE